MDSVAGLSMIQFLALQQELRDQGCGVSKVNGRLGPETRRAITRCARRFQSENTPYALLRSMNIGFGPGDNVNVAGIPVLETEHTITTERRRLHFDSPPNPYFSSSPAMAMESAAPPYEMVPVFFATRRNPVGLASGEGFFGTEDEHMRLGLAVVAVEKKRRPAPEPKIELMCFEACERPLPRNSIISAIDTLTEAAWIQRVKNTRSARQTALVYVHGYSTSFIDAVRSAAQLSYDVGFNGITLAFDWTSKNDWRKYFPDQESAERSAKDLERFLVLITDSLRLNSAAIVAHSLGSRVVSYALRDLHRVKPAERFGQVILAAADIDSATFVDQFADAIAQAAQWTTLYASSSDTALKASASGYVHAGPRVGLGPPHFILHERMDYVDASNIDTSKFGHGYFADTKSLLDDMFMLLRYNARASERNLDPVRFKELTYYRIK